MSIPIVFSGSNIPQYLREKISLPSISANPSVYYTDSIIVDCFAIWGDIHHEYTQQLIDVYRQKYDKTNKIYIFLITDDCEPFIVPDNIRVYRTSLMKSCQSLNEYVLPFLWNKIERSFNPLPKTEKPILGFCGLVSQNRIKTLQTFANDSRFHTNYILRQYFWGGNEGNLQLKMEFEENMRQSHFIMCNRGKGNFSMRLYQTLFAGRIPVFLQTDMILPLHNLIDWNDIAVIADTEEELAEKTFHFWNTHDIIIAQLKCKEIYNTYFGGTNYLDNILCGVWS
jgi:hypothetical protein